jgi:hypothetical protein
MGVQVSSQHVPMLMVGALAGVGVIFLGIVILNHASAKGSVTVGRS